MHDLTTFINLVLEAISSVPAGWWFGIGAIVAGGISTSAYVFYKNYKHQAESVEKYAKYVLGLMLTAVGFVLTIAAYILSNSDNILQIAHLSFFNGLFPYFITVWPGILLFANKFHEFGGTKLFSLIANKLSKWSADKNKPQPSIFVSHLPNPVKNVPSTDEEDESLFN